MVGTGNGDAEKKALEEKVQELVKISSTIIDSQKIGRMGIGFGIRDERNMPIVINPVKNVVSVYNQAFYDLALKLVEAYNLRNEKWNIKTSYT